MSETLLSSAQVPYNKYIEREADAQIEHIITDMARPGYVLVARQMGKTNLLLHIKDKLQTNQNIFVYIDFSTMSGYTEKECLNTIIDTAIELNYSVFEDAENQILQLRAREGYNASRMYNRELRMLLKYVQKIVFIFDEIDALTRTDYSDRVFSLIRGHYYASVNFPELKRATYILSGVIEPKDIIKDPNISPFNIGEKIYMSDFSKGEFLKLINNSDYLKSCFSEVIDRLYFWTCGQPRMSWDLCISAEAKFVSTVDDVDELVHNLYLTTFDKAPIDAIREKVKNDHELRDSLIQLAIGKGDSLSDDVKSKLYLAGIIGYKQSKPEFKNPILEKSLSYDWLLKIHNMDLNYLSEAEKSILLQKDYQKAINFLDKFLESKPNESDDVDKAYYLISVAYFRSYQSDSAMGYIDLLLKRENKSKYYLDAILLKGNALISNEKFDDAESYFLKLLNDDNVKGKDVYIKAAIGLAEVVVNKNDSKSFEKTIKLLQDIISTYQLALLENNLSTVLLYYLSLIEELRGDKEKCVFYLDTALTSATSIERPRLLFVKLMNVKESSRNEVAQSLYECLSEIKYHPDLEDFDNPLGFNLLYASQILAVFMLQFPDLDIISYLRLFLYESKENAVIYIYRLLSNNKEPYARDFLNLIYRLVNQESWLFDATQYGDISLCILNEFSDPNGCLNIINKISNERIWPDNIHEIFAKTIYHYISNNDIHAANRILSIYYKVEVNININQPHQKILINYYHCYILFCTHDFIHARLKCAQMIDIISNYSNLYSDDAQKLGKITINNISSDIKSWLTQMMDSMPDVLKPDFGQSIGRNSKVRVLYPSNDFIKTCKFKHVENDFKLGLCKILEILK